MRVLDRRRFRADVDALLDDLAPGDAEIVLLQIAAHNPGAFCTLRLAPPLWPSPMLLSASLGLCPN